MLLGEMSLGHGTCLSLVVPVDAFLKPVSNKGA